MMKKYAFPSIIIITTLILSIPGHPQRTKSSLKAGNQRSSEKGLKDNRYFFYFINSSVSNMGTDEEKSMYKEAIQRDMIAQFLYMKFMFGESFDEIRKSQKILIDLYRKILEKDISATKELLNGFAPEVVEKNNQKSRRYMNLGYRDTTNARVKMVMADNYRDSLFSMRLYEYVRAIKYAKHGKRYAFLSILESRTPPGKKKEYGILGFDEIGKFISGISGDKKDLYTLIHLDNYYRSKGGKSFYDMTWENPRLEEIEEYKNYLKMK
ncbi:MAG: hypothetical protein MUD12_07185 [Spirochaetes bacterium]|jgi:hypothetical protein|nr:hypothetical protein [Spirochaetota bacterium]